MQDSRLFKFGPTKFQKFDTYYLIKNNNTLFFSVKHLQRKTFSFLYSFPLENSSTTFFSGSRSDMGILEIRGPVPKVLGNLGLDPVSPRFPSDLEHTLSDLEFPGFVLARGCGGLI